MNLYIFGQTGAMGKVLTDIIERDSRYTLITDLNHSIDLVLDFSHASALDQVLDLALKQSCRLLIATTGFTSLQLEQIQHASSSIPIFLSSNYSIGIHLLQKVLNDVLPLIDQPYDANILDIHHNQKKDAPSGTAKSLAATIAKYKPIEDIGIASLRSGSVVGEHQVHLNWNQESLTLTHQAQSKDVFAYGALVAAEFLIKQPIGFYTMEDLF